MQERSKVHLGLPVIVICARAFLHQSAVHLHHIIMCDRAVEVDGCNQLRQLVETEVLRFVLVQFGHTIIHQPSAHTICALLRVGI